MLGRRGPAQAAFTTPELRELGELTRADIIVDPADMELDDVQRELARDRGRPDQQAQRRADARVRAARAARPRAPRRAALPALAGRDPRRGRGRPASPASGSSRTGSRTAAPSPTGEEEVIACGLVIRSIGYRGAPLAGIPFDERRGLISNLGGRVLGRERRARGRRVRRRLGQARPVRRHRHQQEGRDRHRRPDPRGPRGGQAQHAQGRRPATPASSSSPQQCPELVTWEGWRAIDEHETGLGEPQGRPRVKLVRTGEMVDIASARKV